jgi:hypothetical protein
VVIAVAGQNANALAAGCQPGGYIFTNETGAAKNAYGVVFHIKDL